MYANCKVTGTRINRGIGVGLEIPIEITFVDKETATEWLKKALHRINMMVEEKVLKSKKMNNFFLKMKVFFVIQPFSFFSHEKLGMSVLHK